MRDSIDYIYDILAKKYDIPKEAVRQAELSLWKSVRKEMANKTGRDISINNFGSIYLDNYKVNARMYILELKQAKNEAAIKAGTIDQMKYLYIWRNINRELEGLKLMKRNMHKRDVRKKGDREPIHYSI